MKIVLTIIRWIVGLLFIFSGLIKANDPLGLSYKMQEFFEAWNWQGLHDYTLAFAIAMNVFEVLAGVAVIIGWRMKLFSWLLLLLIIFFTFLTSYVLFSGKIKTCGCFGDCVPLTPIQTFVKDVILLLLIIVLFIQSRKVHAALKPAGSFVLLLLTVAGTLWMQFYVLKHLPFVDCLPYKKGNNLVEQMSIPKGAVADSFVITFKYKKDGKVIEFDNDHMPEDLDSTYEYVDRYDKLVRKGNATPKIVDFSLQTLGGNDTTVAILNQPNQYVLLFVKEVPKDNAWKEKMNEQLWRKITEKHIPLFIVTADVSNLPAFDQGITVLRCDATVVKTAARVNPTYILMQQANVLQKYSYADADKLLPHLQ